MRGPAAGSARRRTAACRGVPRVDRSSRRRRPVRQRPRPDRRRARARPASAGDRPACAGWPTERSAGWRRARRAFGRRRRRAGRASRCRGRSTTRRIPSASASTCVWSGVSCSRSSWPIARRSTRCRSRRNRRCSRRSSSAWPASRRASRCCRRSWRRAPSTCGPRTRGGSRERRDAPADRAGRCRDAVDGSGAALRRPRRLPPAPREPPASRAPVAPGPVAPPPAAKVPAPVTKRSTQMSGKRLAVKVERDGQVVGRSTPRSTCRTCSRRSSPPRARPRRDAVRRRQGGQLYTPTPTAQAAARRRCATSALSAGSTPGTTVLPDWIVVTTTDPTGSGLRFGIARPVGDALVDAAPRRRRATRRSGSASSPSRSSASSRCRRG